MRDKLSNRRQASVGVVLMAVGAVGVAAALPVSAGSAAPVQTGPILVPGNPTCGDLAPAGTTWTELKVQPVVDGVSSDGTLTVTIDVTDDEATGPTFDWTSNIGVDAVFVKGGPNGNLYLYDPESTGDNDLHAPTNPENGKFFGLSHVSFCYDVDSGTTTTTESTTTTTESTTTTTQATTTTTTPSTTSTTVVTSTTAPPAPTTAPRAPAPTGRQLPRTGGHAVPLAIGGGLLMAGGLGLLVSSRRLRPR